ncbi:SDR family NAD(P)-dependent oxidoreductase [Natrinema salifodinae]|uniref:NAD(P)-dependent dehydrogenase, short-chain alcohol dehydrogenase family n=1 Tax=Natrinema salifodinae TaxID=1202768 RepID=A0A1I0M9T7_9EURY|nr:SDR family oxidoreductase [Natrinema salifodinae]SEV85265.1 NAD(P)-dependent dehydrogenase, short-chain alcohol dehydrogenase family [Natrinema salifodinae]
MDTEPNAPVSVDGKTAVVIGGTRGIGRAIALGFAADGADVVATSRSRDAVADVAAELRERGAATAELTCDVTDTESIEALRDAAIETFGGVDVLVNSAGAVATSAVTELSDEEWQRDIDVCLTGVFRACRAFGRAMSEGSIINISSMSADQAREERAAYCAAKSGVNGLTRAVAADLAPDIRVNAIAPGFVKTEMAGPKLDDGTAFRETVDERTPMERVATPDEIAGTAVYLASDAASFTTGEIITVDGGYDDSAQ